MRHLLPCLGLVFSACYLDAPVGAAATLSSSGGVLTFEGARLVVPEGALVTEAELTVTTVESVASFAGADLENSLDVFSRLYVFGPASTQFARPATLSMRVLANQSSAATQVPIQWGGVDGGFTTLDTVSADGVATATITTLGNGFVGFVRPSGSVRLVWFEPDGGARREVQLSCPAPEATIGSQNAWATVLRAGPQAQYQGCTPLVADSLELRFSVRDVSATSGPPLGMAELASSSRLSVTATLGSGITYGGGADAGVSGQVRISASSIPRRNGAQLPRELFQIDLSDVVLPVVTVGGSSAPTSIRVSSATLFW